MFDKDHKIHIISHKSTSAGFLLFVTKCKRQRPYKNAEIEAHQHWIKALPKECKLALMHSTSNIKPRLLYNTLTPAVHE
jgi:hypothetical protein